MITHLILGALVASKLFELSTTAIINAPPPFPSPMTPLQFPPASSVTIENPTTGQEIPSKSMAPGLDTKQTVSTDPTSSSFTPDSGLFTIPKWLTASLQSTSLPGSISQSLSTSSTLPSSAQSSAPLLTSWPMLLFTSSSSVQPEPRNIRRRDIPETSTPTSLLSSVSTSTFTPSDQQSSTSSKGYSPASILELPYLREKNLTSGHTFGELLKGKSVCEHISANGTFKFKLPSDSVGVFAFYPKHWKAIHTFSIWSPTPVNWFHIQCNLLTELGMSSAESLIKFEQNGSCTDRFVFVVGIAHLRSSGSILVKIKNQHVGNILVVIFIYVFVFCYLRALNEEHYKKLKKEAKKAAEGIEMQDLRANREQGSSAEEGGKEDADEDGGNANREGRHVHFADEVEDEPEDPTEANEENHEVENEVEILPDTNGNEPENTDGTIDVNYGNADSEVKEEIEVPVPEISEQIHLIDEEFDFLDEEFDYTHEEQTFDENRNIQEDGKLVVVQPQSVVKRDVNVPCWKLFILWALSCSVVQRILKLFKGAKKISIGDVERARADGTQFDVEMGNAAEEDSGDVEERHVHFADEVQDAQEEPIEANGESHDGNDGQVEAAADSNEVEIISDTNGMKSKNTDGTTDTNKGNVDPQVEAEIKVPVPEKIEELNLIDEEFDFLDEEFDYTHEEHRFDENRNIQEDGKLVVVQPQSIVKRDVNVPCWKLFILWALSCSVVQRILKFFKGAKKISIGDVERARADGTQFDVEMGNAGEEDDAEAEGGHVV